MHQCLIAKIKPGAGKSEIGPDTRNQPQNIALRSVVLQSARSVTDFFHTLYNELHNIQLELDDRLEAVVTEADNLASQIAAINDDVTSFSLEELCAGMVIRSAL